MQAEIRMALEGCSSTSFMTQPDKDDRETAGIQFAELRAGIPEALVQDFASDPLAPFDKILNKAGDPTWPLYPELNGYLAGLPAEAVDAAFEDKTFVTLYGKSDRLARIWMTERFLVEESARRRLNVLTGPSSTGFVARYPTTWLAATTIDEDGMVRVADFSYNNATIGKDGFSFTVCSTTDCPNSTYWLLRSFYEGGVAFGSTRFSGGQAIRIRRRCTRCWCALPLSIGRVWVSCEKLLTV